MLFCNDDFGRSTGPGGIPGGPAKAKPTAIHQTHKKSPYVYRKPHPATSSVLDGSNCCLTTLGLKKPGQVKFLGASDATFLSVPGFGSFGLPLLSRFRTAHSSLQGDRGFFV